MPYKNLEKRNECAKRYRDKNKEKISLKYKQRLEKNDKYYLVENLTKEQLENKKKSAKKEYEKNKESYIERSKKYVEANQEKVKQRKREWYLKNKERLNKEQYERKKERLANDSLFKLTESIRSLINISLKRNKFKKNTKTENVLGCSFQEFKIYLESKFESWMNFNNKGLYNGEFNYGWDIDHIIPISSATTEEEIIKLNHYTNLQPLCSKINRDIKKDKLQWQI